METDNNATVILTSEELAVLKWWECDNYHEWEKLARRDYHYWPT